MTHDTDTPTTQPAQAKVLSEQDLQDIREAYAVKPADCYDNFPTPALIGAIHHRNRAIMQLLDHIEAIRTDDSVRIRQLHQQIAELADALAWYDSPMPHDGGARARRALRDMNDADDVGERSRG